MIVYNKAIILPHYSSKASYTCQWVRGAHSLMVAHMTSPNIQMTAFTMMLEALRRFLSSFSDDMLLMTSYFSFLSSPFEIHVGHLKIQICPFIR
jgi:hypothetical protein